MSATLVNDAAAHLAERPSVKLKIPGGGSDIFNSMVVSASGQSLYSISSNSKRTTLVSCKDNVEVATVEWDRSSPRMVYRRKKMKCKEWLPLAGPDTEYVPSLHYCPMSFKIESPLGLACSHTVTNSSLGCTSPPLVT
jgi:hypothetical protein